MSVKNKHDRAEEALQIQLVWQVRFFLFVLPNLKQISVWNRITCQDNARKHNDYNFDAGVCGASSAIISDCSWLTNEKHALQLPTWRPVERSQKGNKEEETRWVVRAYPTRATMSIVSAWMLLLFSHILLGSENDFAFGEQLCEGKEDWCCENTQEHWRCGTSIITRTWIQKSIECR